MAQLTDYDVYRRWQEKLEKARSRLKSLEGEMSRIPGAIESLQDELSEAVADAELDGRDPDEDETVQELRQKLRKKRRRRDEVEDDIKAAERVVERLERQENEKKAAAAKQARAEAMPRLASALEEAREALAAFREAKQQIQDVVDEYATIQAQTGQDASTTTEGPLPGRAQDLVPEVPDLEAWEMKAVEVTSREKEPA